MEMSFGGGGGGECLSSSVVAVAVAAASTAEAEERQLLKGEMAVHPLCKQLVVAHVGCLCVATTNDHFPLIDAQLAQSSGLLHSYATHHHPFLFPHDKQENFHHGSTSAVPDAVVLVQGAAAVPMARTSRALAVTNLGAVPFSSSCSRQPCPARGAAGTHPVTKVKVAVFKGFLNLDLHVHGAVIQPSKGKENSTHLLQGRRGG